MRKGLYSLIIVAFLMGAADPLTAKAQPYYSEAVAVLMYHHIHDQDHSTSTIHSQLFYNQLHYLKAQGFHFISMQQFRQFLQGKPLPPNAVLVTFDDGYESFYSHAYPILKQLSIPSVNFCITKHLAGTYKTYVAPMKPYHLRQLSTHQSTGSAIEFQCHTNNMHHYLGKNPMLVYSGKTNQQQLVHDITVSMQALQPFNNQPVDSLSYPYGRYNRGTLNAVRKAGIHYAFTIQEGLATRSSSHLTLPRINAGNPNMTPIALVRKLKRLAAAQHKTLAKLVIYNQLGERPHLNIRQLNLELHYIH